MIFWNETGSPQLLSETVDSCRRLLHRRRIECMLPLSSSIFTDFAHRTEARPERLYPSLSTIETDGLPLRCLMVVRLPTA